MDSKSIRVRVALKKAREATAAALKSVERAEMAAEMQAVAK